MPRKKKEYLSPVKLKCTQCVYKTKNRSDLRRHERRHKDVKFPCDVCNMPFMTLGHLGAHRRSSHNMNVEKVSSKATYRQFCDKCDYTTIYSSDMARHRRKHDVNQHHCPICNYPFGHITTLTAHIKKYHGKDQTATLTNGREKDEASEGRKGESKRIVDRTNKLHDRELKQRIQKKESRMRYSAARGDVENTLSETKQNNADMSSDEQKQIDEVHETVSTSSLLQLILRNKDSSNENKKKHSKTSIKKSNDSTSTRKQLQSPKKAENKTDISKTFNCNRCEFATKMEETFRRHTNRHDRGKFRCDSCGMPFLFKVNLDKHVETKHVDGLIAEVPNDESSSDSSFDTSTINSSTPIKCDTCQFVTFSYNQFQAHKEDHSTISENAVSPKQNFKENHAAFSETDEPAKHNHKKIHEATSETNQLGMQDDTGVESDISLESEYPGPDISLETGNEPIDTDSFESKAEIFNGVQTREVESEEFGNETVKTPSVSIQKDKARNMIGVQAKEAESEVGNEKRVSNSSIPTPSLIVSDKIEEEVEACNKESIEEDDNLVEEYHCKHCTYVTSDKKFIKLHMSMHGSDYMVPKKGNARKKSNKANDLGYEIRLRRLDNKQTLNGKDRKVSNTRRGPTDNEMKSTLEQTETSNPNPPLWKPQNGKIADQVISENGLQKAKLDKRQSGIRRNSEALTTKARGDGVKSITDSVDKPLIDLVGVLTKEDFKRTKTFYTVKHTDSGDNYGCKLCADVGEFRTKMDLYNHFKLNHQILREKICATCKYCNGPFPVLE